jgi:zinc transport system substrate-binding protein
MNQVWIRTTKMAPLFKLMRCMMLFLFFVNYGTLFAAQESSGKPYVLVSVAPHKFFVEKIAGDTITVELMVPAGASSHTFEPTPKQMLNASHADIWFQIGEGFEPRASNALRSHNPGMQLVDLRKGLNLIYDSDCSKGHCHHCAEHQDCVDPHFWLSARQAKIQAKTIAEALSQRYPQHAAVYAENLKRFTQQLDALDTEITTLLAPLKNRTIMVSHPAYAYFCRDYNLQQLSIEFEGKDPSPQQLTKILTQARKENIKTIFIQMQYNNKGARLIANEIGAKVVTLDPYAEQYIETMRDIASHFAAQE